MNKSQIKLAAILFGIFFPVLASTVFFMMKNGTGFGGTTNKGYLISPVLDVTTFGLIDSEGMPAYLPFDEYVAGVDPDEYIPRPWGVVYLGGSRCDEACVERITLLRQLHMRLGPEAARVQRWYLNTDNELEPATAALLAADFPQMVVVTTAAELQSILAVTSVKGQDPVTSHYIYVVDPVGNVMLYFTPENTPEEILSDLDKLLDQSSLG